MTIFIGDLFDPFGRIPADWMIHKSFSPRSSHFHVFIPHYFLVKLKIEICSKLGNSIHGTCCKMKKSSIMIIHVIMLKLRLFGFINLNAILYHQRLHEIYSEKMAHSQIRDIGGSHIRVSHLVIGLQTLQWPTWSQPCTY